MEIRQMENFIVVCEELHFTRAADRIGISQPTLSQQIRALEDELGVPLFDRVGKKIVMTQAGTLFLEHCVQMVRHLQNTQDALAEFRNDQRGKLVIGVLPSDLDYRLTPLLVNFHSRFPKVKLKVVSSIYVLNQVLDNEVDIGIELTTAPDERLVRIPLCSEEYVLVVSENHVWAERNMIEIKELRDIQTVMFPEGFTGRELVDGYCRKYGFTLNTIMETSSATSIISLVKANVGGTVLPYPLIKAMNEPTLRIIRITDDAPYRHFEVIHRSDRYLTQSAKAFIEKTVDYFNQGYVEGE
ncbi:MULTISPECIES: LysR family transcriptional regulator [Paenibacillus]|uniref:LysR family transcriptional regulator n=1 Tax=Paenibacillus TaxID=44249 RepID=UPI000412B615|nr:MULTISPECIES: LysR family transcriptional regulator [Paenibacillus]KGP81320.1 LysR family transcriptional regulator [Paenibacillus sp. MAEPY2]KGP87519.1 LysR family transcriptional regulator [Paenibacillus sp. MAEPY1]OZQ72088.1 LysR family transcriptional regulator [Paenibacillus taichungensis]HBU84877.1 LysR family transcriptional regulator [Paenibacillus sp.]